MVDARLPAEWLGSLRIDKLSDRAFRILAGALMWCNGQGTDGAVPARYTKYLHPDGDDHGAFEELETAGLWSRVEDGYLLAGWSDDLHQSTAEEIQGYRDAAKRRQQAYRDRQKRPDSELRRATASEPRAMLEVTHNVTRDVTANVGSGSLSETTRKSAYVTRNVTRHADSPFCAKHPAGTSDPCGACARARTAHEARQDTISGLGWDCAIDGHKLVVDGTCAVCAYRPRPTAASCATEHAKEVAGEIWGKRGVSIGWRSSGGAATTTAVGCRRSTCRRSRVLVPQADPYPDTDRSVHGS